MCSFSAFLGNVDIISAELWAIHKACYLCMLRSFFIGKDIHIVSDSRTAVAWVNDEGFGNLKLVSLIYEIRSILRVLGSTSVIHNLRTSNSYADSLAKRGVSLNGEIVEWGEEF
ncbi:hypothetical protein Dsin_007808 [Dipteronia sinensis]|uniref:RNase H type-1 domain-containing protein n=1 Tax=Dipteronia sinensis TaxID=43782 RepID=A0AAE0EGY6_9ROSI|nr:hypothetical protein Dsin_007808 [Dipteronia sinensis]